jgi:hypothetical protein
MVKEAVTTESSKDLAPFSQSVVGGEDHGAALVTGIDELLLRPLGALPAGT